jgi:dihydroxyacetone kinase-like protein
MPDTIDAVAARAWVEAFAEAFDERRDELNELDRRSGDGDFGTNLHGALLRVREKLAAGDVVTVRDVFGTVSSAFLAAGGTSGPLFGMWFKELSRAAVAREEMGVEALAAAFAAGAQAVQAMGKARVGDSTMVDAMVPAAAALQLAAEEGRPLDVALAAAAAAAETGAESTVDLVARRGRASYVGEVGRGVLDPGAAAVALFFAVAPRAAQGGA